MPLLRTQGHPQGGTGAGLGLEIISGQWVMTQPFSRVQIHQLIPALPPLHFGKSFFQGWTPASPNLTEGPAPGLL